MDTQVGAWVPPVRLGEEHVLTLDRVDIGGDTIEVEAGDAARLREVVQADAGAWSVFFAERTSELLIRWLRVLTLAEEAVPGCDTGAKSPVIVLARLLRERDDYPAELTAWIRSVSSNRFLPYGSLSDRLKG